MVGWCLCATACGWWQGDARGVTRQDFKALLLTLTYIDARSACRWLEQKGNGFFSAMSVSHNMCYDLWHIMMTCVDYWSKKLLLQIFPTWKNVWNWNSPNINSWTEGSEDSIKLKIEFYVFWNKQLLSKWWKIINAENRWLIIYIRSL